MSLTQWAFEKFVKFFQVNIMLLVLTAGFSAFASPSADDFNSSIDECQAKQKDLSQKLEGQLKPDKIVQNGKQIDFKNTDDNEAMNNVAVDSSDSGLVTAQVKDDQVRPKKQSFRRTAQELRNIED
jgi:hypothetical protein